MYQNTATQGAAGSARRVLRSILSGGKGKVSSSLTTRLPALATSEGNEQTVSTPADRTRIGVDASDEALMVLICQGDKDALASLFRRYARIVRGVAYRVLRDASEADDLLQDLFLMIHRKCGMFDASRGPARFWILQMTYHRAIGRRRYLNSRHFYTRVDLDDAERDLAAPASGSLGLPGNSSLKKIFEALTEDQRQTLRLFFVEGYTLTEIATKLSQTRGNVKHHYFRGLEKLRKQFFDSKLRGDSAV
jgi:RNA polymerase sigma-70 factor (ECF subfamily)